MLSVCMYWCVSMCIVDDVMRWMLHEMRGPHVDNNNKRDYFPTLLVPDPCIRSLYLVQKHVP